MDLHQAAPSWRRQASGMKEQEGLTPVERLFRPQAIERLRSSLSLLPDGTTR